MNTLQKIITISTLCVFLSIHIVEASNNMMSADGRYIVFESNDTSLVDGKTSETYDVFLRDTQEKITTRISLDPNGDEVTDGDSQGPYISSDGRYIFFSSDSESLVAEDTNEVSDIFRYDRQTEEIIIVSLNSTNEQGDGDSYISSISPDGRYILFGSKATNLVVGDTNATDDVFVKDMQLSTIVRVSVDSNENQSDSMFSGGISITSDGRYVVFVSQATNLVADDTNGLYDVFLRDLVDSTTVRISVDSDEVEADESSFSGFISDDGRYVVFNSAATNLVADDTNGITDIFLRDIVLGTTERIVFDMNDQEVENSDVYSTGLSSDGRYIVFESDADSIVEDDINGVYTVYTKDLQTGVTTIISQNSDEVLANDESDVLDLSINGQRVLFNSAATNLVADDTNGLYDVFLRDSVAGTTTLISRRTNPKIQFAGTFTESATNDGTLEGYRSASIIGDDFINAGGVLTLNTDYTLSNVPAGLTPVMSVNSGGYMATLTFTGTATVHENANDVANLTVTFLDGAFVAESIASEVTNYTNNVGAIDFTDAAAEEPEVPRTRVVGGSSSARPVVTIPVRSTDITDCRLGDSFSSTTGAKCSGSVTTPPTPTTPTTSTPSFTKSLKQGMTDPEVKLLQQYLNSKGFTIAPTGPGSKGMETSFFGPATKAAVIKFQLANKITPAVGFFGPLTRSFVK